jgi:hypothetical protein
VCCRATSKIRTIQTAQLKLGTSQHTITEKTVTEQTCRWLLRLHRATKTRRFALPENFVGQMVSANYIARLKALDAQARYIHRIITKAVSPSSTLKD